MIPTTEFLLSHREHETQASWEDLLQSSEDVLASHVLRIPPSNSTSQNGKDGSSLRDSKGKAKQFGTVNGKTLVLKDNFIYSNKGFKSLNQAQLLQDVCYYQDSIKSPAWLVYYISRPLIGTPEPLDERLSLFKQIDMVEDDDGSAQEKKKEITNFDELLKTFPALARQMHGGLDKLFKQFTSDAEADFVQRLIHPHSSSASSPTTDRPKYPRSLGSVSSLSTLAGSSSPHSPLLNSNSIEARLRNALERLVISAIELFQNVDKHQLSLLGNTTTLSGPQVERMIERHVTEHFHKSILFPKIREMRQGDDESLERDVKHMADIDISQVGIHVGNDHEEIQELAFRLKKGVRSFKRMESAESPQAMLEIILDTEKDVMSNAADPVDTTAKGVTAISEKSESTIVTNADLLVSMLLLVVIRSQVHSLHARLLYMLEYIFISDIESGEIGYALSTFEAVLAYISNNSPSLKRASRANRGLWQAAKKSDILSLSLVLAQDETAVDDFDAESEAEIEVPQVRFTGPEDWRSVNGDARSRSSIAPVPSQTVNAGPGLAHVFPFEALSNSGAGEIPKAKKRVSLEAGSRSGSSSHSLSRPSTLISNLSVGGDTSVQSLCRTKDQLGNSVLMSAVETRQPKSLQYMLQLHDLFPLRSILEEKNYENTTLLSAAVQTGHKRTVDTLLDFLLNNIEDESDLRHYLASQDSRGRTVAHYCFNAPHLIERLGKLLPWLTKDKNGQTPLFALCRSYDHDHYKDMVDSALSAVYQSQENGKRLQLDLHTDGKFNTLLHVVNSPKITRRLLHSCESDPNAKNDKHFTPLMVASKFARVDSVRVLFGDERTDVQARDQRGLTAVELAKDDEIRNRIDDLVLLSTKPAADGRITTIVRSFFVEDGSIRLVLKSGAPNDDATITVTTSRRSLTDFENLSRWLALEHPASWLPQIASSSTDLHAAPPDLFRSPFQLPSRPSRAVLRDSQLRLDAFLQILLNHPTFSTHEMVWEFFLVPDINQFMLGERARAKATARVENLRLDYSPPLTLDAAPEIQSFITHAIDQIRAVHDSLLSISRSVNLSRNTSHDLVDAANHLCRHFMRLGDDNLAQRSQVIEAFRKYIGAVSMTNPESSPMTNLHYTLHASLSTTSALLTALARPGQLIAHLSALSQQLARHQANASRTTRWPSALGLLDEARARLVAESLEKAGQVRNEMEIVGCELRYVRGTVAAELAGWRGGYESRLRSGLREFARGNLIRERERLEGFRRAGRELNLDFDDDVSGGKGRGTAMGRRG